MQRLGEGNSNYRAQVIPGRLVFRFQLPLTNEMRLVPLADDPIEEFFVFTAASAAVNHLLVAASASVDDLLVSAEYLILFPANHVLHVSGK